MFDEETLKDLTDGLHFQQHAFFDGSETQQRLQLYTDEFEIVTRLRSKKQIHKISSVYFVLGNIALKHCSSLQNIHVLVRHRLLQKYGYEPILQPLLHDFCELQSSHPRKSSRKTYPFLTLTFFDWKLRPLGKHLLGSLFAIEIYV